LFAAGAGEALFDQNPFLRVSAAADIYMYKSARAMNAKAGGAALLALCVYLYVYLFSFQMSESPVSTSRPQTFT